MVDLKMAELKMAAIIKLSQNEWVWVRLNYFESEFCAKWLNPRLQNSRLQNSRWLPSLSLSDWISLSHSQSGGRVFWVNLREDNKVFESKMAVSESKMAEFKMAAIINLSQNEWVKFFLCQMAESKMAEFKMAAIIKLSENEWVKFFLYKMAELRMADFKIAAIIKLSQNEWVKFFMCKCWEIILAGVSEFERKNYDGWIQDGQIQDGRIQDGCHHQVESEWMSEVFFVQRLGNNLGRCEWVWEDTPKWMNPRWWNSSWQNTRWLLSSSWVRRNEWSFFVQNGWIQDGRIQDGRIQFGCHH